VARAPLDRRVPDQMEEIDDLQVAERIEAGERGRREPRAVEDDRGLDAALQRARRSPSADTSA
jgi:hypothetical protein